MLELSTFGSVGGAAGNCRLYPAKAARGNDKRDWPWGNTFDVNKANIGESGIGGTSAVGCFPAGASPYGCLDMAGDVWEWTQSKSAKYPYKNDDGREELSGDAARVVRGGAWGSHPAFRALRLPLRPSP